MLDELENQESALAWARDAGHLQAMQATLRAIQCGPQDFQCSSMKINSLCTLPIGGLFRCVPYRFSYV